MFVRTAYTAILSWPRCVAFAMLALATAATAQENPGDDWPLQFQIDSESSWLRILVYRGGLLRGFGHNHVISHGEIRGSLRLAEDLFRSELSLEFDVAALRVDEAESRALAGRDFAGRVSEKDIAATRSNMLGPRLLQAEQYPSIRIHSDGITGNMPEIDVEATVLIRGQEFCVVFPAHVELNGDSILASGETVIRHAQLGLEPFKAALGTLQVRDSLVLEYLVVAKRMRTDARNEP